MPASGGWHHVESGVSTHHGLGHRQAAPRGRGQDPEASSGHRRAGQCPRGPASKLTDDELPRTPSFRKRLEAGESLDDLLPEAFAAVREASKRTLGKRHFDVQLMGGAALRLGNVAEMKTGEPEDPRGDAPSYLNALTGKGVHIITVNDYLAGEYQSELMGRIHRALGIETDCILSSMTPEQLPRGYAKDITYGTNNEFGFDYLRDNMAWG